MNRFVFLTHVTPVAKRSSLRQRLFELYEVALKNQTYQNWFVIQLHEGEESVDGKFYRYHFPDGSAEQKAKALRGLFGRTDFISLIRSADYLVKLDDDDLISPDILKRLAEFNGDLYYDAHHTFYDISSGVFTQQERPWVASTCIHKTEHALAQWSGAGASPVGNLLYTDHSKAWHEYYAGRNSVKADPSHPVYARVLSPSSITSGNNTTIKTIADIDFEKYYRYLRSFGDWTPAVTQDFASYKTPLAKAWKEFSGKEQAAIPSRGAAEKLWSRLGGIVNKVKRNK